MKSILILLIIIISSKSFGQCIYVGITLDSARISARNADKAPEENIDRDKEIVLAWEDGLLRSIFLVYFKSTSSLSYMTCIVPNNSEAFSTWLRIFETDDYIKSSETEWKVYKKNRVYLIKLLWVEDMKKNAFYVSRIG